MSLILAHVVLQAALLAATPAATPAATELRGEIDEAVRRYDRGDYLEARAALENLDHAGALDGPLLYRLYFCERATGREGEAARTLDRARQALEAEIATAAGVDVPFYLANTYSNLGQADAAAGVARSATAKIESGAWKTPETGIGLFQIGKLYQDQGRQDEALSYYGRAVDAFDLKDGAYAGNARWALRYMGNVAYSRDDFAGSEKAFERLVAIGGALRTDWEALATARARAGKLAPAAEAWNKVVKLEPADADDARYSARLAEVGLRLAPLPTTGSGGAAFRAMGRTDLESAMRDLADQVRAAQARAAEAMKPATAEGPARPLDPKLRKTLADQLREARGRFVAAGLEYAMRRLPIRETAFHDGYAVLVFQDTEWELPPDR